MRPNNCSLFFVDTGSEDSLPVAIAGNVFVSPPILLPGALTQRWLPANAVTLP